MLALALLSLLLHVAAIGTLAPGVEISDDALPWIVAGQLPLMGVTAVFYGIGKDRESDDLAGWSFAAFGLGATVPILFLLARYDIGVGPADPYGAPESINPILWYAGFAAIASVGHTMFIARPIINIAQLVLRPLRRRSVVPALALSTLLAAGLGVGAVLFLDSPAGSMLMEKLQARAESNPTVVILAGVAIAVVLNVTKRATVPRERR